LTRSHLPAAGFSWLAPPTQHSNLRRLRAGGATHVGLTHDVTPPPMTR